MATRMATLLQPKEWLEAVAVDSHVVQEESTSVSGGGGVRVEMFDDEPPTD